MNWNWLPWLRRGYCSRARSRAEAQQHLDRLAAQQPEVDRIVSDLRLRLQHNHFREAMERAFRGET